MRYDKIEMNEFDTQVRDWDASLTDVRQPLKEVVYQDGELTATERTIFGTAQFTGELTQTGFSELCDKIDVPYGWLSTKCPEDLRKTVIDRMKRDYDKPCLLRYRGGDQARYCRAVLSDKYMVYNHLQVWEAVKSSIEETPLGGLQPKIWKPLIDDRLSAWILFDGVNADPDQEIRTYDGGGAGGLKPAIKIRNSEDGTGRLGLYGGFYRSYCSNGVIFGFNSASRFEQVHLGNNTALVTTSIRMAIAETANQAGLAIDAFLKATQEHINKSVDEIVQGWTKKYNISDDRLNQWVGFLGRSQTWGDIVMGTSDFAGTLKDHEEMDSFEAMAGEMLFAPHREFVEVRR